MIDFCYQIITPSITICSKSLYHTFLKYPLFLIFRSDVLEWVQEIIWADLSSAAHNKGETSMSEKSKVILLPELLQAWVLQLQIIWKRQGTLYIPEQEAIKTRY